MKRIIIISLLILATAGLTSCNTKVCYCCTAIGNNESVESETYTDLSNRCANLSTNTRTCLEEGERIPGCVGVAVGYKK